MTAMRLAGARRQTDTQRLGVTARSSQGLLGRYSDRLRALLRSLTGARRPAGVFARSIDLYARGKTLYTARDFTGAKDAFDTVVADVPTNGSAWYYLGRIAFEQRDYAGAITKFDKAVQFSPENPNPRTWRDRAHAKLNRAEKTRKPRPATPQDDEAPAANPTTRRLPGGTVPNLLDQAHQRLDAGAFDEALHLCRTALGDASMAQDARLLIARIHVRKGTPFVAVQQLAVMLDDEPSAAVRLGYAESLLAAATGQKDKVKRLLAGEADWRRQIAIAEQLVGDGQTDAGVAILRALWIVTNKLDHARQAAELLARSGRVKAAAAFLQDVRDVQPFNKAVYLLQADFFVAHDRFADAKKALQAGRIELPDEPAIMIRLARLLADNKRWEESAKLWRDAAEASPNLPGAAAEIADCYRRAEQYERAVKEYRVALRKQPRNEKIYRGLSQSLRRLGRQHDAIAVLRDLVSMAPGNFDNWNELIYTLARAEIADQAVAALDAAAAALGSDSRTTSRLALSAERALLIDEAESLLRRAVAERPLAVEPVVELGRHYLRQGLVGRAHHAFQTIDRLGIRPDVVAAELGHIDHMCRMIDCSVTTGQVQIPEDAIRYIAGRRGAYQVAPPVRGRVAIVSTKLASGGAERQTAMTAAALSARTGQVESVSVHCLSLSSERGHDFYLPLIKDLPIEVTEPDTDSLNDLLDRPELAAHADLIRLMPADLGFMVATWTLQFLRRRPEVVHAWQVAAAIGGALAAILAGVPRIVLSTRNTRPENKYRRWKRYMNDAYNVFIEADGIVLSNNSKAGGADYDDWLGVARGTTRIVYNGVDFSRLDVDRHAITPAKLKERLGIPAAARIMGGVFRLSGEKQPLLWVQAAALVAIRFPDMHFIICGEGTMRNDILKLGRELGLGGRLHLPGNQRPIAPWYGAMDVFLLASRNEGLPNVLLEAQFLGCPVVATDVGGVREVMEHSVSGWTVTDQTAEHLADRVIYALEDAAWHQRASVTGRAYVSSTFSVQSMCDRTLEVYGLQSAAAAPVAAPASASPAGSMP